MRWTAVCRDTQGPNLPEYTQLMLWEDGDFHHCVITSKKFIFLKKTLTQDPSRNPKILNASHTKVDRKI